MYNAQDIQTDDISELSRQITAELKKLEQESLMPSPNIGVIFTELHVVPKRLRTGLTVLADGTDWNPGAGQGVYTYYGSAWHKLG